MSDATVSIAFSPEEFATLAALVEYTAGIGTASPEVGRLWTRVRRAQLAMDQGLSAVIFDRYCDERAPGPPDDVVWLRQALGASCDGGCIERYRQARDAERATSTA